MCLYTRFVTCFSECCSDEGTVTGMVELWLPAQICRSATMVMVIVDVYGGLQRGMSEMAREPVLWECDSLRDEVRIVSSNCGGASWEFDHFHVIAKFSVRVRAS